MTSGEVTVETGKSQFIFYPSIFVCKIVAGALPLPV
jgi:hypothetical protein